MTDTGKINSSEKINPFSHFFLKIGYALSKIIPIQRLQKCSHQLTFTVRKFIGSETVGASFLWQTKPFSGSGGCTSKKLTYIIQAYL